jgi:hypothetical protein
MTRKSAAILSIAIVLIAALIVVPAFALAPLVWLCEAFVVVIIVTALATTPFTPPALVALTSSAHLARSGLRRSSR